MAKKYRRGLGVFRDLFGEEMATESKSKGRDAELIAKRDVRLYHRYYYYSKLHKFKVIELVWEELQDEFDLSTDTIPRIIDGYVPEIKRLMNEGVTVEELRKLYPKMVWEHPKKAANR